MAQFINQLEAQIVSLEEDTTRLWLNKTRSKSLTKRIRNIARERSTDQHTLQTLHNLMQRFKVKLNLWLLPEEFHKNWCHDDSANTFHQFHSEINLTESGNCNQYSAAQYEEDLRIDNELLMNEVVVFLREIEPQLPNNIHDRVPIIEQLRSYNILTSTIPPINTINTQFLQASNDSLRIQGIGSFGACYSGSLRGVPVMIKRVSPANYSTKEGAIKEQDELRKEALILQYVNLPGVIRLFGVDDGVNPSYIVMEEVVSTLSQVLHGKDKKGRVDVNYKLTVLWEVCDALKHLESFGIVHRDIRPENVYITRYRAKLANFGFEGKFCPAAYKPPELLTYTDGPYVYSRATDMYAFGIMMNEVMTEVIPFQININLLIRRMFTSPNETRPALYEDESNAVQCAELQGIIRRCWDIETERPTFALTEVEIKHLLGDGEPPDMSDFLNKFEREMEQGLLAYSDFDYRVDLNL